MATKQSMTEENDVSLHLAAENWSPADFARYHRFSQNDERVILKLIAHGPVLLEGGRGSGKSALMIAATQRVAPYIPDSPILGVYINLKEMSLLQSSGATYRELLCKIIVESVQRDLLEGQRFGVQPEVSVIRQELSRLSARLQKRIVLFFDDAAHIGREVSLGDFFDTFRVLSSSSSVSCKASIYPGVTQFGSRFDVYNDATVVSVVRDESQAGYAEIFAEVIKARYPGLSAAVMSRPLSMLGMARLLGQGVVGNMRGFVIACNYLEEQRGDRPIGVQILGQTLLHLAQNHYWPLFEEVRGKLGKYSVMTVPAEEVMQALLQRCASDDGSHRSAIIHRDVIARMPKVLEVLEYVGFISRREASRAMKSGGRGSRYVLNLCNLLEAMQGSRLTIELFERWTNALERDEPIDVHSSDVQLGKVNIPKPLESEELEIVNAAIARLKKSKAYPYGLTDAKIRLLKRAGYTTIAKVAAASDSELKRLETVGDAQVRRIRNTIAQAVWM
jgi:hypothetical protein